MDFLLLANFCACAVFSYSDLISFFLTERMLFQQKMIQVIVKLCVSPQVQDKLIPVEALVPIVTHFLSWLTLMQNTLMVCSVLLEIIYKILKTCKAMIKL